jgi:hypothetical protein
MADSMGVDSVGRLASSMELLLVGKKVDETDAH